MEEEGFTGLDMWITSACHWFHSTMEDESTKEKLEKHNEERIAEDETYLPRSSSSNSGQATKLAKNQTIFKRL